MRANGEHCRVLHIRSMGDYPNSRTNKEHSSRKPYKVSVELILLPVTLKISCGSKESKTLITLIVQRISIHLNSRNADLSDLRAVLGQL